MSTSWILWLLLSVLTGNPLLALALVLVLAFSADRFTFRVLPSPARAIARFRRGGELTRLLSVNPHDRRARLELADLLLARDPARAVEVLRPNVEAGDEDVHTAFVLGSALARSGAHDRAERVLGLARAADPAFRMGEIDLELGRMRLARRDFAGAREALERLVAARPGTVEGRWLLARALGGAGEARAAARVREDGWREYASLPRFQRRHERPFAWRLKPARAALTLVGILAACGLALALLAGLAGP